MTMLPCINYANYSHIISYAVICHCMVRCAHISSTNGAVKTVLSLPYSTHHHNTWTWTLVNHNTIGHGKPTKDRDFLWAKDILVSLEQAHGDHYRHQLRKPVYCMNSPVLPGTSYLLNDIVNFLFGPELYMLICTGCLE